MYTMVGRKEVAICHLAEEWFLLLNINMWISIYFCCSLLIVHLCFGGKLYGVVQWTIWEENFKTSPLKISVLYFISYFLYFSSHTLLTYQFLFNNFSHMNQCYLVQEGTLQSFYLVFNKHCGNMTNYVLGLGTQRSIRGCPRPGQTHSLMRSCCLCQVKGGWY